MLLSFNDICIIPSIISNIESRSECCPYRNNMLPLITAPMSSVIDGNNWKIFQDNKINTIIPRTVDWEIRTKLASETFIAVSLVEFERIINYWNISESEFVYICVDIANGHMKKLLNLCKQAKEKFGDSIQIMTGNIANPKTYLEYARTGIDYVRCSIGNSPVCLTAANTGVFYPMVSLLQDIAWERQEVHNAREYGNTYYKSEPKVIADGGFSNFDQIIKALALGADYVMLGKIFAMSEEACGEVINWFYDGNFEGFFPEIKTKYVEIAQKAKKITGSFPDTIPHRKYYGMSTKKAQSEFGNTELKTAEGIETLVPIKYTLAGWCDNFISYLRSAMSYCNSKNLYEFKKNATIKQISNNSFNSYFK